MPINHSHRFRELSGLPANRRAGTTKPAINLMVGFVRYRSIWRDR